MGKRKSTYEPQGWESKLGKGDTSANVHMSLMLSPAWASVGSKAHDLYYVCKSRYFGGAKDEKRGFEEKYRNDPRYFCMNLALYTRVYHMKGGGAGLISAMSDLINAGFIDCVICGKSTRTKSLYCYSDRWIVYDTPNFSVPASVKTNSMIARERKSASVCEPP